MNIVPTHTFYYMCFSLKIVYRTKWSLFILAFIINCSGEEAGKVNIKYHPTERNIISRDSLADIIYAKETAFSDKKWIQTFKERLSNRKFEFSIGTSKGDDYEMFGNIKSIEFDDESNLFVLDSQASKIHIFSNQGIYLNSIGKPGQGPGEFRSPSDFILYKNVLYVADRYNEIKIFRKNTSEYKYETSIFTRMAPENICKIKDTIFFRAPFLEDKENIQSGVTTLIHAFNSSTYELMRSFGKAYLSDKWIAIFQLSQGLMACDRNSATIATVFYTLPYIYGYSSSSGELKWVSEFDDFITMPMIEKGNSINIAPDYLSKKTDVFANLIKLKGSSFLLVQIKRRVYLEEKPELSIYSYLINSENGEGFYLGKNLPLISVISDRFIGIMTTENFPVIKIYKY